MTQVSKGVVAGKGRWLDRNGRKGLSPPSCTGNSTVRYFHHAWLWKATNIIIMENGRGNVN